MSIGFLGSYTQLLAEMHAMVSAMPAARPVTPPPSPAASVSPSLDTYVPAPSRPVPAAPSLPDPSTYFISQIKDRNFNPDAPSNNRNCGPATLAMALRALGLRPPTLRNPNDTEAWVDAARYAMEGDTDKSKYTDEDQMLNGAIASGAKAYKVTSLDEVAQALQQGQLVALAGNPQSYENRLTNAQYNHFNGGHFILVTGVQGNTFTISDPQAHIPSITVSRDELRRYMAYQDWNVGVAIGR
jgi:hypothetical protein